MPDTVTVLLKNGETVKFGPPNRVGSYGLSVQYEGVFVTITDEWGAKRSWPASEVVEVNSTERARW